MSTRRQFFKQANCAAVGSASLASTLFSLRMTAGAASGAPVNGKKALVCLFFAGGNDSYNMLVPRQAASHAEYAVVRGGVYDATTNPGGLGLAIADLKPITSTGQPYPEFGIHPSLSFLKSLYDGGKAAFVANVGTLVEPTTKAQYDAKTVLTPVGLFSHSDQQMHWQTLVPQVRGAGPKGWAGRLADCLTQANSGSAFGMNISLAGNNVLQVGPSSGPYITDPSGATLLTDYRNPALASAIDSILGEEYKNIFHKTLASSTRGSIDKAIAFDAAVSSIDFTADFPPTSTGKQLRAVAEILAARDTLGMNRQIFFVQRGGWDHHKEVIVAQQVLFTEVNAAIEAFWNKLVALGIENDVVLYTASDFGRTLTSNGAGSDHAWGGNAFILGGSVVGGRIYGQYPVLAEESTLDLGRGRLLPTTSVDAYSAEMASWFGVPSSELGTVFPNAENFFDPATTPHPLGILG